MKNCYYAIGGILFSGEHILATILKQNKNINLSYVDAKNLLKLEKNPQLTHISIIVFL